MNLSLDLIYVSITKSKNLSMNINLFEAFFRKKKTTCEFELILTVMEKHLRHSCSLHESFFIAGPSPLQSFPPFDGGGLVQVLVNICVPPPHVTLH